MQNYTRYKTEELLALLDVSGEKLRELDAASTQLRSELVLMANELVSRGVKSAIAALETQ